MGMNLMTACHKCKKKVFHYRLRESDTILPFYMKHRECMAEFSGNLETLDDQIQWRDWMDDESEYTTDVLATQGDKIP